MRPMFLRHSWIHDQATVRHSPTAGRGVFASAPIAAGERVAIFGGDIMHIDEILQMPDSMQAYAMQIEERFVLAARGDQSPEDTDFFNHSCDANCGFRGTVFLVAMRDIQAGEELTFDYAMVVSQAPGTKVVFSMQCQCGASRCRGAITENDWQRPELRERYRGFFSQYLQERIQKLAG